MDEETLLEFRKYLTEVDEEKCIICGICCNDISHIPMLKIEEKRLVEKYGDEYVKNVNGTPFLVDNDGSCSGLESLEEIYENMALIIKSEEEGIDSVVAKLSKARCRLHEERAILCRAFPYYPFPGSCGVLKKMYDTPSPDVRARLDKYCVDYITSLRYEIIDGSGILQMNLKPTMSSSVIWLEEKRISHRSRATRILHPFWSMWSHMKSIELDDEECKLLRTCDGTRNIEEIAAMLDMEPGSVLEKVRDFMLCSLLNETQSLIFGPSKF